MDELYQCGIAFQKLRNTQYNIVIGRKGVATQISVRFSEKDFYHLVGLHKVSDIELPQSATFTKAFSAVLSGRLTLDDILKSATVTSVFPRMNAFLALEDLFDKNDLIFRYNSKVQKLSVIQADYLLSTPLKDNDIFIFLSKNKDDFYFCRSLFPKSELDYTEGQTRYTLLYKEKVNLETKEVVVQYNRIGEQAKDFQFKY